MKRLLLACGLLCGALAGCDSASESPALSTGADASKAPASGAALPMLRFDSKEAFLSAVESVKQTFTSPDASARTSLPAVQGFTSLYAAQHAYGSAMLDPTSTADLAAAPLDIPDPALASVLNASGEVMIAGLRYQFGATEAVAYSAAGEVVSRHPVVSTSLDESGPGGYYPESCDPFGRARIYGRAIYRVCGQTWNRGYFGVYASQGSRTDHYQQRKNWSRGWHYADDNAVEISIYCRDANTLAWIGNSARPNDDTIAIYFDRGLFGTGNDTDRRTQCDHSSSDRDWDGRDTNGPAQYGPVVNGFTITERSF